MYRYAKVCRLCKSMTNQVQFPFQHIKCILMHINTFNFQYLNAVAKIKNVNNSETIAESLTKTTEKAASK